MPPIIGEPMTDTTGDRTAPAGGSTLPVTINARAASLWRALRPALPLLGLLLLAGALRFALLGTRELFRDEAASWLLARYPWPEIGPRAASEPYAPIYVYLLKAWMIVAGDGAAALRAPSAAFGFGVVVVMWAWARAAIGPRVALLAAALIAISPLAIANARDARMYAMETFFSTLAWWLLWRLLVDGRRLSARPIAILLAAGAIAAELWTLPTGVGTYVLQVAVVGVLLVRAPSAGGRAGAAALIAGLVAFVPGMPRLLSGATGTQPFWTPAPNVGDLPETFVVAFGGQAISPAWLAMLPLAALAGIGFWSLFRRPRETLPTALCLAAAAALILLWWTVSLWRSAYDTRYLGAALPPLAIAIACGWQWVAGRAAPASVLARRLTRASGVALVLLLAAGTAVFATGWLQDSRLAPAQEAVVALRARVHAGDVVLVADARSYLPVAYLTDRDADPIALDAPVRYWRSGSEPAFTGSRLVAPSQIVDPQDSLAPGDLPGLSPTGSIWLLAITDPTSEVAGFTPLHDGRLLEAERYTVVDNGASGWILRLRPAP